MPAILAASRASPPNCHLRKPHGPKIRPNTPETRDPRAGLTPEISRGQPQMLCAAENVAEVEMRHPAHHLVNSPQQIVHAWTEVLSLARGRLARRKESMLRQSYRNGQNGQCKTLEPHYRGNRRPAPASVSAFFPAFAKRRKRAAGNKLGIEQFAQIRVQCLASRASTATVGFYSALSSRLI